MELVSRESRDRDERPDGVVGCDAWSPTRTKTFLSSYDYECLSRTPAVVYVPRDAIDGHP
jgi:hypothetical protein